MADQRDLSPPPDDDDVLAAELALGALDAEARAAAQARQASEPAFAARVAGWEARLSGLAAGYERVAPPPAAKARVRAALRLRRARAVSPLSAIWRSAKIWRAATAAAAALALFFALKPAPDGFSPEATRVFPIAPTDVGGGHRFVALVDSETNAMRVLHIDGALIEGRSYELWLVTEAAPPESLGVIRADGLEARALDAPTRAALLGGRGALAVSLEPQGGSPTGAPTGPIVALGRSG